MRGFREISLVGRFLSHSSTVAPPANRICLFCQSRAQQPKRPFSQSSRHAASVQPEIDYQVKTIRSAADGEDSQRERTSRHSEIGYDIGPGKLSAKPSTKKSPQRLRRERRTTEVLAARRTKQRREYSKRKNAMDERNANQGRLMEMQELVNGEHPDLYRKAETAEGLRIVGAEPKKERASFELFARPSLNKKPDLPSNGIHGRRMLMTAALYRAVVETYAAISAKKRVVPSSTYHASTLFNETKDVKLYLTVDGDPEGAGAVRLMYPDAETERKVLASGRAAPTPANSYMPGLAAADELVKSWGRVWLHISLEDPEIKLGVIKRLTYLTGRRIPDYIIDQAKTTFILLSHIARPDPPKNVYEAVKTKTESDNRLKETRDILEHSAPLLTQLPNVKFRGRQLTVKDKEIQIGRYKVIRQELKRRGLKMSPRAQTA